MRCPIVVGRDAELACLTRVVDGSGGGACVLVLGEAGVGKTRLTGETAAHARARGHPVLVGRAAATDQVSPLRPVAEALLDGLRDRPPPDDPALRTYLPALGTLVPHWAPDAAAALAPAPVVVAEAVLRVLRWLAPPGRGALLLLEDLHWADQETLAVLAYLADHVAAFPVALLVTARGDEPTTGAVEAALSGRAVTLRLDPLTPADVVTMAAACLGVATPPDDVVARLRTHAGGLPLVVEDLVDETGPSRYRDIVARRLAALPGPARGLVDAAAVLGEQVDRSLLARVSGLGPRQVGEGLRAAAAARLLSAPPGPLVAFRHALTRDVVLDELPDVTLAELSARAAATLEQDPVAVSERLGELWLQAGDARRATDALRRAAATARASGAAATAEALLRRALAVAPPGLAPNLRLELLELLAVTGRVEELAGLGRQALDDLAHDADLTAAVHLLLARAAVGAAAPRNAEEHLRAVRDVGTLSPRRQAQLGVVQAAAVMGSERTDRLAETATLATDAVRAAERAGDGELTCEALELLAAAHRARDLGASAEVLRRELAVAEQHGLMLWRLRALNELGTVELLRDAAPDRLERALELALRVGAIDTAASASVNLAAVHAMTGRIDTGLAAAEQARELAGPLGAAQAIAAATAIEGVLHGFAGNRPAMEQALRRAATLAPDDADLAAFSLGAGRGLAALLQEERAEAVAAFDRAREMAGTIRTLDPSLPGLLIGALDGTVTSGDIAAAHAASTAGARWSDTWLGYAHAVALARDGELGPAVAAFAAAERAADRYPLFRAVARRLVAESAAADRIGDPVPWLREAEAEFVARGLHRIAAACRALLARAGAPATRRRGRDGALPADLLRLGVTAREAEVLDLVGERLPNRDIATRLFLSPRTVEKHVASLLLKTALPDRDALARLARERQR